MSTPQTDDTSPPPRQSRLVPLADAAREAGGISVRTLRDLQRAKKVGCVTIGRRVFVPRESLEKLIAEGA